MKTATGKAKSLPVKSMETGPLTGAVQDHHVISGRAVADVGRAGLRHRAGVVACDHKINAVQLDAVGEKGVGGGSVRAR